MNPLNIFSRKDFKDILFSIKNRMPFFLQETRPSLTIDYPYHWVQILDSTIVKDYEFAESVLLNTVEYNKDYEYTLSFNDGSTPLSVTNLKNTEEELTNKSDLLIEILED